MQITALLVSLLLMAVIAFARAAQAASAPGGPAPARPGALKRRRRAPSPGMLAPGLVVSPAALWRWPHAANPAATRIDISGGR